MPPKTLIITGAGSNLEHEFLTAKDLRKFLIFEYREYFLSLFSGLATPEERKLAAEQYAKQEIEEFSRVFLHSRLKSIDYFLQLNPKYAEVGKIGIVCAIARAESKSTFVEEALKEVEGDWYTWLFNEQIANQFQSQDLEKVLSEVPLRFVTFNYDRSIEHFLFRAIAHALPQEIIRPIFLPKAPDLEFLNVRHMYGRIGRLPWQRETAHHTVSERYRRLMSYQEQDPHLVYGRIPRDNAIQYMHNINLIGERVQQDKTDIAKLFKWADRIFFLGFGFAPENLEALNIAENLSPRHDVFGTAIGFLDTEIKKITKKLSDYRLGGDGKTIIADMPILTLLRMYLT